MKKHAWFKKGMRMNKNRLGKRVAVAAGFFFLCVAPRLTRAQSSPPSPVPGPRTAAPVARPKKTPSPKDDFAGLSLTDDQKAKIDQIHQSMKPRIEAVVKDQKLTPEQRDAMLDGYDRMERGQIYRVLTPEQQKEVRDKARARHAAEQAEKKKQSPPK
jgi:Spy/CpxP family protein refolding chaperone